MAASVMAAMLGRARYRLIDPRYDTWHGDGTGARRHQRHRESARWLAAETGPSEPLPAPYADASDCAHGCNGDEIRGGYPSQRCDWKCHPDAEFDPEYAARLGAAVSRLG